jgi:hypothetical protein
MFQYRLLIKASACFSLPWKQPLMTEIPAEGEWEEDAGTGAAAAERKRELALERERQLAAEKQQNEQPTAITPQQKVHRSTAFHTMI